MSHTTTMLSTHPTPIQMHSLKHFLSEIIDTDTGSDSIIIAHKRSIGYSKTHSEYGCSFLPVRSWGWCWSWSWLRRRPAYQGTRPWKRSLETQLRHLASPSGPQSLASEPGRQISPHPEGSRAPSPLTAERTANTHTYRAVNVTGLVLLVLISGVLICS